MGESYYDVLGVDSDATSEEIRSAYRERVLETHPDHNDDPDAADQFARVATAESVITDASERARYDRLGHDAYVCLGAGGLEGATGRATDEVAREGRSSTAAQTGRSARSTSGGRSPSGESRGRRSSGHASDSATGSPGHATGAETVGSRSRTGASHHARQRYRRRSATATDPRWGDGFEPGVGRRTGPSPSEPDHDADRADEAGGAGFAVHDWTDEVDLESPFRPIDRRAAVGLATVSLLYPLFVFASVTPAFPLPVNVVVAACTLLLVGYLLTWPRIALGAFGGWSAVVAAGLPVVTDLPTVSVAGGLVLGTFVVPFALALAVWWALRP